MKIQEGIYFSSSRILSSEEEAEDDDEEDDVAVRVVEVFVEGN